MLYAKRPPFRWGLNALIWRYNYQYYIAGESCYRLVYWISINPRVGGTPPILPVRYFHRIIETLFCC